MSRRERTVWNAVRAAGMAAVTLALGLCVAVGTAQAADSRVPEGYPTIVTVPEGVLPVYLVGEEWQVDETGARRLLARTFELNQEVAKTIDVRAHYERLFRRLSWCGGFRTVQKGTAGWFDSGPISVDVAITPRTAERDHVKIRVRVAVGERVVGN
ncbi:MAG: hypothetical protein H6744_20570 [Deltaproteobacteria bacterium]|nr:hypothetical protein [Deltaproteobacteria bacterium]MCB9789078.1 hypothetical protein [Deltaproteobacteria bacterium]